MPTKKQKTKTAKKRPAASTKKLSAKTKLAAAKDKAENNMPTQPSISKEKFSFIRLILLLINCLGIIIFLTLLIIYLYVGVAKIDEVNNEASSILSTEEVTQLQLKKNYQEAVVDIQEEYTDDLNLDSIDSGSATAASNIINDLLGLRVPEDWKNLHLQLVLAYNDLSDSIDSHLALNELEDKDSQEGQELQNDYNNNLEKAREKLNALSEDYSWITSF